MSTVQPVYGNNGFKAVNAAAGTSVPQLEAQTVKTANLNVLNSVSFFGADPVGQADFIGTIGNTATGTQIATAVNALINVLKNAGLVSDLD
jgi:hypothetical protein